MLIKCLTKSLGDSYLVNLSSPVSPSILPSPSCTHVQRYAFVIDTKAKSAWSKALEGLFTRLCPLWKAPLDPPCSDVPVSCVLQCETLKRFGKDGWTYCIYENSHSNTTVWWSLLNSVIKPLSIFTYDVWGWEYCPHVGRGPRGMFATSQETSWVLFSFIASAEVSTSCFRW